MQNKLNKILKKQGISSGRIPNTLLKVGLRQPHLPEKHITMHLLDLCWKVGTEWFRVLYSASVIVCFITSLLLVSFNFLIVYVFWQAQPCSNEVNYHFLAMRKFLDDWSRGIIKDTVSIEKGTNTTESYGVLHLTRWCVNHAEKLASEVVDHFTQS